MKFYMHAGSLNHGCEAIVRSTAKMTEDGIELFSQHPEEDLDVGLRKICDIKSQGGSRSKSNPLFILVKAVEVLTGKHDLKHWYANYRAVNSARPGDLYLSIGGDNYCYGANPYLIYLNRALNQRGARTGLWGCSIEPETLRDPKIIEDMKRYAFISARETITYNALREAGLRNVYLYPDPAFTLEKVECALPEQFSDGNVVGINLSPLVQKLDMSGKIVLENYVELVDAILNETDMQIALIPHVCKAGNDDRESMKVLAQRFPDNSRICFVNQDGRMECGKLKYAISKCRFMITARTHASIAAYSTNVPTLVAGYSVKARGIARDIFGSEDRYVMDIRDMQKPHDLLDKFRFIRENEEQVRNHLQNVMPEYIEKASEAAVLLK